MGKPNLNQRNVFVFSWKTQKAGPGEKVKGSILLGSAVPGPTESHTQKKEPIWENGFWVGIAVYRWLWTVLGAAVQLNLGIAKGSKCLPVPSCRTGFASQGVITPILLGCACMPWGGESLLPNLITNWELWAGGKRSRHRPSAVCLHLSEVSWNTQSWSLKR